MGAHHNETLDSIILLWLSKSTASMALAIRVFNSTEQPSMCYLLWLPWLNIKENKVVRRCKHLFIITLTLPKWFMPLHSWVSCSHRAMQYFLPPTNTYQKDTYGQTLSWAHGGQAWAWLRSTGSPHLLLPQKVHIHLLQQDPCSAVPLRFRITVHYNFVYCWKTVKKISTLEPWFNGPRFHGLRINWTTESQWTNARQQTLYTLSGRFV